MHVAAKLQIATIKTSKYSAVDYSCKFISTSGKRLRKPFQVENPVTHILIKRMLINLGSL